MNKLNAEMIGGAKRASKLQRFTVVLTPEAATHVLVLPVWAADVEAAHRTAMIEATRKWNDMTFVSPMPAAIFEGHITPTWMPGMPMPRAAA